METEKQLLEEIGEASTLESVISGAHQTSHTDAKDEMVNSQRKKLDLLEESVIDYESTIGQFRDLVTSLQLSVVWKPLY